MIDIKMFNYHCSFYSESSIPGDEYEGQEWHRVQRYSITVFCNNIMEAYLLLMVAGDHAGDSEKYRINIKNLNNPQETYNYEFTR